MAYMTPEEKNQKFQEDFLAAFDALADEEGKMTRNDFVDFMKERDWISNGTFLRRCENSGLVFTLDKSVGRWGTWYVTI